jgi:hypothetical protein
LNGFTVYFKNHVACGGVIAVQFQFLSGWLASNYSPLSEIFQPKSYAVFFVYRVKNTRDLNDLLFQQAKQPGLKFFIFPSENIVIGLNTGLPAWKLRQFMRLKSPFLSHYAKL